MKTYRGVAPGRGTRRLVLLLSAILVAVLGGPVTGATAAADVGPQVTNFNGVCESGEFCLFQHADLRGYVIDYGTNSAGHTCDTTYTNNNYPGTNVNVNDTASSWLNNTGRTVVIYDRPNYGPADEDLPGGGGFGNLRDTDVGNDHASSHRSRGAGC